MKKQLCLSSSWICLLFFSSVASFPAAQPDSRFPYASFLRSGGGPAPSARSGGDQQPDLNPQQPEYKPSAPEYPSNTGLGYVSPPVYPLNPAGSEDKVQVSPGSSSSYDPSRFTVTYDPSSEKPSSGPQYPSNPGLGYMSPPVYPLNPAGSGDKVQVSPGSSESYKPNKFTSSGKPLSSGLGYVSPPVSEGSQGSSQSYEPSRYVVTYEKPSSPSVGYVSPPVYPLNPSGPGKKVQVSGSQFPAAAAPYFSSSHPQGDDDEDEFFFDPTSWMPTHQFPDLSVWDEAEESSEVGETSPPLPPMLPSSYIVQSRNGYQRARQVLSHTNYSPEAPAGPGFVSRAKGQSAGAKGLKKH